MEYPSNLFFEYKNKFTSVGMWNLRMYCSMFPAWHCSTAVSSGLLSSSCWVTLDLGPCLCRSQIMRKIKYKQSEAVSESSQSFGQLWITPNLPLSSITLLIIWLYSSLAQLIATFKIFCLVWSVLRPESMLENCATEQWCNHAAPKQATQAVTACHVLLLLDTPTVS